MENEAGRQGYRDTDPRLGDWDALKRVVEAKCGIPMTEAAIRVSGVSERRTLSCCVAGAVGCLCLFVDTIRREGPDPPLPLMLEFVLRVSALMLVAGVITFLLTRWRQRVTRHRTASRPADVLCAHYSRKVDECRCGLEGMFGHLNCAACPERPSRREDIRRSLYERFAYLTYLLACQRAAAEACRVTEAEDVSGEIDGWLETLGAFNRLAHSSDLLRLGDDGWMSHVQLAHAQLPGVPRIQLDHASPAANASAEAADGVDDGYGASLFGEPAVAGAAEKG